MAPLTDPALLAKFIEALREWNCDGYVLWKKRATDQLRSNFEGRTQKSIGLAMYEHVRGAGEIDEVPENYEGYRAEHPYHYDFRMLIDNQKVYVETVFDDLPMGPTITVVSVKHGWQ